MPKQKKYLAQRSIPQIDAFTKQTLIDPGKELWELLYISERQARRHCSTGGSSLTTGSHALPKGGLEPVQLQGRQFCLGKTIEPRGPAAQPRPQSDSGDTPELRGIDRCQGEIRLARACDGGTAQGHSFRFPTWAAYWRVSEFNCPLTRAEIFRTSPERSA